MKDLSKGTPTSLIQAIINGLLCGQMNDAPENIELSVKDFLSQGLTKAAYRYENSPEALEAIQYLIALWDIGEKREPSSRLVAAILASDVNTVAEELGIRKAK